MGTTKQLALVLLGLACSVSAVTWVEATYLREKGGYVLRKGKKARVYYVKPQSEAPADSLRLISYPYGKKIKKAAPQSELTMTDETRKEYLEFAQRGLEEVFNTRVTGKIRTLESLTPEELAEIRKSFPDYGY